MKFEHTTEHNKQEPHAVICSITNHGSPIQVQIAPRNTMKNKVQFNLQNPLKTDVDMNNSAFPYLIITVLVIDKQNMQSA